MTFVTGSFSFDFDQRVINVTGSTDVVIVQDLLNSIRSAEEDLDRGITEPIIALAGGKFDLGGGVLTGISVALTNSWAVRFDDRPGPTYEQVTIKEGNLVGGPGDNPISSSQYTQVILRQEVGGVIAQASSSSGITADDIAAISASVWDATMTDHTASNTTGETLFGAGGGSSPTAIAQAVWSSLVTENTGTVGSFGERVGSKLLTFIKWFALKD
jgi:hypothetical protein